MSVWIPKRGPAPEDDTVCVNFLLAEPELIDILLAEHCPSLYGPCSICPDPHPRWHGCPVWRIADRARAVRTLRALDGKAEECEVARSKRVGTEPGEHVTGPPSPL